MKRVTILKKQDSQWNITSTHVFTHRHYSVDKLGNFYRNGVLNDVTPDDKGNKFFMLIDDNWLHIRFKAHQIVLQTYRPKGLINGVSADHIDRNRLNNALSNLKYSTHRQQSMNRDNVSYKYKKIKCLNNGLVYDSCQSAEDTLNLVRNTVSRVARGERSSIHGYKFNWA